jgi:hypothetical protein
MIRAIKNANLLLLLMFLVACAALTKEKDLNQDFNGVHPDLAPYLADFLELVGPDYNDSALSGLSMAIKPLNEGDVVGLCKRFTVNGGAEILVDSTFWDLNTQEKKEVLIFHELGHCLCWLGHEHFEGDYSKGENAPKDKKARHKKGFLEDGCPVTVMHPNVMPTSCYERHKEHYRWELRLRCQAQKFYYGQKDKSGS